MEKDSNIVKSDESLEDQMETEESKNNKQLKVQDTAEKSINASPSSTFENKNDKVNLDNKSSITDLDKENHYQLIPVLEKENSSVPVSVTESLSIKNKQNNLLNLIGRIKPGITPVTSKLNVSTSKLVPVSISNGKPVIRQIIVPLSTSSIVSIPTNVMQKQTIASSSAASFLSEKKTILRSVSAEETTPPSTSKNLSFKFSSTDKSPPQKASLQTENLKSWENLNDDSSLYSNEVFSHMLDFLYMGIKSRYDNGNPSHKRSGSDPPSLEMPDPLSTHKSGIEVLLDCFKNGTAALKEILRTEVDAIFECRRCRGLFRSLPNLIKHKTSYCRISGTTATLFQHKTNSSSEEDRMMKNLLHILNPQDNEDIIQVEHTPIQGNPNAVYQKMKKGGASKQLLVGTGNGHYSSYVSDIPKGAPNSVRNFNKPFQSTAKSNPQYIILNQPKAEISRGSLSNGSSTNSLANYPGKNSKVIITSSGKIGALSNSTVDLHSGLSNSTPKVMVVNNTKTSNSTIMIDDKTDSKIADKKSITEHKAKPKCPICFKAMAERKNVKRHLVHVHMLSVAETMKLMHKTMPLPSNVVQASNSMVKKAQMLPGASKSCEELKKICVEVLCIGAERKVYVLPKSYIYPHSHCPICSKGMSSRNNVRRHMLESHDFLIQGDKKYYQLKLLLSKQTDLFLDGTNRSIRRIYGTTPNIDVEVIKAELEKLEAEKLNAETESNAESQDSEFSETSTNAKSNLVLNETSKLKASPASKSSNSKSKYSPSSKKEEEEKEKAEISITEGRKMIDAATCKCLTCKEEFCRRQNLKNHMVKVHNWSKSSFNSIYDDAYAAKSEDDESDSQADEEMEVDEKKGTSMSTKSAEKGSKTEISKEINKSGIKIVGTSNKIIESGLEGGKVLKTVVLHKIVTTASTSSQQTTTVSSNNVNHNGVSVQNENTSINSLIPHGTYVMKTAMQVLPSKTITVTAAGSRHSNVILKRKLSSDKDDGIVPVKREKLFDISKNLCCLCNTEFENSSKLKRHMIEVHSCTMEQVLGASRDSKSVDPHIQKQGEELGYDIGNAKCLLCSKYFFVRMALKKHLNKVHAFKYTSLIGLSSDEEESDDGGDQGSDGKKTYGVQLRKVVKSDSDASVSSATATENNMEMAQSSSLLTTDRSTYEDDDESPLGRKLSKSFITRAQKIFPSQNINASQLKCTMCKHKYGKLWDLKVHILKHIGLGIYACKFCTGPQVITAYRLDLIMDHISKDHPHLTKRAATASIKTAKVNNKPLWKLYRLPLGR